MKDGGGLVLRAVIFDLWNTLADWPVEVWAAEPLLALLREATAGMT